MRGWRGDFMWILAALVGVVVLVLVLMQGAYAFLTRPSYVNVTVELPAGQAWQAAQTDKIVVDSGTLAYDVRWQEADLIVPAWDAVLTYMTDGLAAAGWREAPPALWEGAGAYDDVCAAVATQYLAGQELLEWRYFVQQDGESEGQPETVCVTGWALGSGGYRVVLVTTSAPHPNW